ncbi:c-type cytochrome [Rhizobium wenxiniae]|uniref:c-type cytochrome n=1 Tax=Rhizobium wenxiniae TaxID=1737357 RepID=UPI003C1CF77D
MIIRWKHLIVLVVLAPLLGLAVGWSGLMSVRASTGHWAVTDWFLHWVMRNSVSARAVATGDVPPLNDPGLVPGAAGHFETGCAVCHGSPAQPRPDSVLAMLPPPPDLKVVVPEWTDAELFEIVKHGVRFTGMPAWPVQSRDDEIWSMVAFLRKLPDMDAQAYIRASGLHGLGHAGDVSPLPITCESCHAEAKLNDGSYIPRLAGQSEAYLLNSLKAYAEKTRPSGIMQVAVGTLSVEGLPELAAYYANQTPTARTGAAHDPILIEKGRILAEQGRRADKIPACLSCHDKAGANPAYPILSGQNSAYLQNQLALFQSGGRGGSEYHHLMSGAAKELAADDFSAVAAYFSAR